MAAKNIMVWLLPARSTHHVLMDIRRLVFWDKQQESEGLKDAECLTQFTKNPPPSPNFVRHCVFFSFWGGRAWHCQCNKRVALTFSSFDPAIVKHSPQQKSAGKGGPSTPWNGWSLNHSVKGFVGGPANSTPAFCEENPRELNTSTWHNSYWELGHHQSRHRKKAILLMKEIQHHLGCVKPENDEQDFFHQSTVSWSTIVSPKPIRSWNCWWKDFQTNKLMTRKISQFLAIRFMVSYLSTVSPDFYTINCFILVCFLFYKHIYIYIDDMINMIKSCQEDPFCPLLKDFAILSFFQIASSGVCGWPLATKQQL